MKGEREREKRRGGEKRKRREKIFLGDVGEIYIPHETGTINF